MMFFSRRQREKREASERIYAACREAARRPGLFLSYGVPDTFQGRFEMMALCLFPVLNRLMHEPGDDPELARIVSECFVDDMDAVFREMGVGDPTVPKRMKALYRSFAGRITAYLDALADETALTEAVARNVFPDMPVDEQPAGLARYLKEATVMVSAVDLNALRRGDIPFPELFEHSGRGASR